MIILLGGEACWTKAFTELLQMIVMAFDSEGQTLLFQIIFTVSKLTAVVRVTA